MKNTKLIDLLSVMDKAEFVRLDLFVRSPANCHSQRALQLWGLLEKEYPLFDSPHLTDEKVFRTLFGKKTFAAALLRNVISDLYTVCEEFVLAETLRTQNTIRYQLLINYFTERKLFAAAENLLHQWEQQLKTQPRNADYFQSAYKMVHASFSIAFHRHYKGNLHKLYKRKNAAELFDKLQDYYLYEFAGLSAEVINSFHAHNREFNSQELSSLTTYFLQHEKKHHPIVLLRLQLTQLLLSGEKQNYITFKKSFLKNLSLADSADLQTMIVMLHGFSAERAWKGDLFFKNELEELGLLRQKLNMLLDESHEINPIAFWNITQANMVKKGKKAAADFIKQYSPHLPEKTRTETVQLATASIAFYENKFEQALALLMTVGKPFFASEIVYRRLLIKCHYELKQWDRLQITLETTEKFLRNNQAHLPPQISEAFKTYIESIRLLFRGISQPKLYAPKLRALLQKHPGLYDAEWIAQKLAGLT